MANLLNKPALALLPTPFQVLGALAAATVFDTGWVSIGSYLNGRLRGNAHQDVAGTLTISFTNDPAVTDLVFTVTQDATQPDFQYPFDVIVLQPFVRVLFVNGGGAATFSRANAAVLSQ